MARGRASVYTLAIRATVPNERNSGMSSTQAKPSGGQARFAFLRPSEIPAADRGGGNKTVPLVTRATGTKEMLIGMTTIAAGSAIALHTHNCEESVLVLEGRGIAEVDGEQREVQAMDTTWIPPEVPHRFRNASDTEPLRIFWVYASVDATRTLVETGETRPVSAEHDKRA